MAEVKDVIAKNLVRYRKAANLTQYELAVKLNYSDKAVSKWERGEALPDITVLKQIAEIYNISVDDLMKEEETPAVIPVKNKKLSHFFVTILSFILVWLVATIVFVFLNLFLPDVDKLWLAFIYAIPVGFIVLTVFCALWWSRVLTSISVITLAWTLMLSIYLTFDLDNLWLLFVICIPFTLITIFWNIYRGIIHKKK